MEPSDLALTLLGLLPVLACLMCVFAAGNRWPNAPWLLVLQRAVVFLGAGMVVGTELLSLFGGVTRPWLVVLWILPTLVSGGWLMRRRRGAVLRFPRLANPLRPLDALFLSAIAAGLLVMAVVAWAAPVQTWDSLTYHMARVAHWAQNASLRPFATGIERQVYMPPGAEIAYLQTYLLSSGDRLVNLVNWSALVFCAALAGWVARLLGAGRTGQLASVALVVSLPMAIIQASSTMTDLIVGLWLLAAAGEALWIMRNGAGAAPVIVLALAAGLAVNTKPTAYVVLFPLAAAVLIGFIRTSGWRATAGWAVLAVVTFAVVNAAYWGRNWLVYGSPFGPPGLVHSFVNERFDLKALASNLLRNASLHAGTPIPAASAVLTGAVTGAHDLMGIDLNDERTTAFSEWTKVGGMSLSEVRTGNTLHAALLAATFVLVPVRWRKMTRQIVLYALVLGMAILLYSLIFKWQVFGNRLHLPLFLLACPLIGAVFARGFPPWVSAGVCVAALLLAWPWYSRISSRPLLPADRSQSILVSPRDEMVFYYSPGLPSIYQHITDKILESGCRAVGIMLLGDGAEYPFWMRLSAPRQDLQIEWLVTGTPSARFADPEFAPCAVVCQGCPPEDQSVRGAQRVLSLDSYALYLAD